MRAFLAAAGVALVLVGAAGAARITGTRHADLILGTLRADRIGARAGNDRIDVAGGGRDRVSCGLGADLVAADSTDRLSGDCETVSLRISIDPFAGGGALHASEAEPDSFSWGSTVVAAFQVGRFATGGAQNIGFAVSRDAGRTWKSGLLPGLTTASRPRGKFSRASDPSVAYDAFHGVWLIASLGFSDNESALLVSTSPDGLHWSDPYAAGRKPNGQNGILFDKEWIACDNGSASPFRGRCYLSYSDIEELRLATQTSFDGGKTWSTPVASTDNAGRRGIEGPAAPAPQPVSLPNGVVSVPLFDDGLYVVRSTDGGGTFSTRAWSRPRASTPPALSAPARSRAWRSAPAASRTWPGRTAAAARAARGTTCCSRRRRTGSPGRRRRRSRSARATTSSTGWRPIRSDRAGSQSPTTRSRPASSTSGSPGPRTPALRGRASSCSRPSACPSRRIAQSNGAMVGDYISTSFAGGRAVAVFTLAQSKLRGRLRQATYAASVAVP